MDLVVANVRVIVEVEPDGDGPPCGRRLGHVLEPAVVRGVARDLPRTVVVLKDSDNGPVAVVVAERTVGVDVELFASWYKRWYTKGQGNR